MTNSVLANFVLEIQRVLGLVMMKRSQRSRIGAMYLTKRSVPFEQLMS